MACTTCSVSYREIISEEELVQALLSGEVPQNRMAHLHALLEEAPAPILLGLIDRLGESYSRSLVEENMLKIAITMQTEGRVRKILARSSENRL